MNLLVALAGGAASAGDPLCECLDSADLKRHCSFLAADALEGRGAGSRGGQAAAAYLAAEFRKLGLEAAGDGKDFRQAFGQGYCNVIGRITGSDINLAREMIVVGAHYDHVGYGSPSNSYGPFGQIHNGADDNASGVALLLELAQAFRNLSTPLRRTVIFAAWDAEEAGLYGSQHWVTTLGVGLNNVRLAVNLDMVGRLQNERVIVVGWRSAPGLRSRLAEQNDAASLTFQFEPHVPADSDHYPFYARQVPVLHFDTGKHGDYHRPSDDVDKLDWKGILRIGEVVARLVQRAGTDDALPRFRAEAFRESSLPTYDPKVRHPAPLRLGLSWKPDAAQQGRIEVAAVTPQSPAQHAGLQPGDTLVRLHSWRAGSDADLRTVLVTAPAEVQLAWRRPGSEDEHTATVRLLGQPGGYGITTVSDAALPGMQIVASVLESSPADRAGLQPGDVLMRWDEAPLGAAEDFSPRASTTNGSVDIQIERNGRLYSKKLEFPSPP